MRDIVFRIILRRFLELFFINTAISTILTLLNIGKILDGQSLVVIGIFVGIAVFVTVNFRMLRNCYFDLRGDLLYYFANIAAYLLFALLSVLVYLIFTPEVYTWLFAMTKFLRYTNIVPSVPISAAVFHLIGFSIIFIAPIGIERILLYDDDE